MGSRAIATVRHVFRQIGSPTALGATINGVTGATANLTSSISMAATIAGQSAITAALTSGSLLAATIAGVSGFTAGLTTTPTGYAGTQMARSSLRAYYRLGDLSGTTAVDQKGAAAGTYVNSPTLGVTGALTNDNDKAVDFTGSPGRYVTSGVNLGGGNLTLAGWVNASAWNDMALVGQWNGNGSMVYLSTNGKVNFYINATPISTSVNASWLSGWHYIVCTYDGTTAKIYVDAVLQASGALAGPIVTSGTFYIGSYGSPALRTFPGKIDEVTVDDVALTQADITASYTAAGTTSGGGGGGGGVAAPSWWIAPVTSGTVNLTGLDTTGAADMTSAIQAQIDAAPNGRIIQFPAGTLKISSAINYHGRNNLIFDGTGCTLNNIANANTGDSNLKSTFFTRFSETAASHITIRNFHIQAASPSPGTFQSGEFAAALGAQKGSYIEFAGNTCTGLFGDMVTLNENPDHVWIHENTVTNCGRHMLSCICATTVMCESNTMGTSGYGVFDIEPESGSVAGNVDITFRNNTYGSYGTNTFVSINGGNQNKPTTDIVITGNTGTGKALRMYSIYTSVSPVQRLTFSNNTSTASLAGPIFNFDYIDTLVVQNNSQTHTGTLISIGAHCTNVTNSGNTPP